MRYIRAFFIALWMTLRGKVILSPAEERFPRLFEWLRGAKQQLSHTYEQLEQNGFDKAKRESVTIRVDGRDMSMETALATVRFHLDEEYLYMLNNLTEHSITGLYASNMNDTYWIATLAEKDDLSPEIQAAIGTLATHLQNIPPSNEIDNTT